MGTRGFVGLVIDGEEKIGYQHLDSYPDGVGLDVLEELRKAVNNDLDELVFKAHQLTVVNDNVAPPSDSELEKLKHLRDGFDDDDGWYDLLRETQGSFIKKLEAGFVEDAASFALDSLFCEWGYLVDFDAPTSVFQVYRGFQKKSPLWGRWEGTKTGREYSAVELVEEWPLLNLPSAEEFLDSLRLRDEE